MAEIMIVMVVVMLVAMFGAGHKGVMSGHGETAIAAPEQGKSTQPDKPEPKNLEIKP